MNQCPHNLDLYQWMVGMPARVQGFVSFGKHHKIEVEDEVTAYFEHADGMVGHFITTTGESPGSNRLEIVGEMGKLIYENDELTFFRNAWSSRQQIAESSQASRKYRSRARQWHSTRRRRTVTNSSLRISPRPSWTARP